MQLITALIYWVIVCLWLAVLIAVCAAYLQNSRTFSESRLLLAVVGMDASRNIIENLYFGLYFGGQYGLFPSAIVAVLGLPQLLIIPKLINVAAACFVIGLLLWRWLPKAARERAKADFDLQQAESRFRLLVAGVKEYAIYLLDPKGNVTSWNTGAERIKGYVEDEVVGVHFGRFYTEEDRLAGVPEQTLKIAARDGNYETTGWRARKDGSRFWANVVINAIRGRSGELIGFAKVTKDVTEQRVVQEKLKQLALFDTLTGLPNRASLLTDLARLLDGGEPTAVAIFGLDGFKDINDSLGHSTGDQIIREVARRLRSGEGRNVYRLSGDEFALVLPGKGDPLVTVEIVTQILKSIEKMFELDERRLFVGASVGIAIAPIHASETDELIANADLALHQAKKSGGRQCRLFIQAMRASVRSRQDLDAELRRAYAAQEFVLYFQPQISVKDGVIVGAEALLRWRHPQRGLLTPAAFIDVLGGSAVAKRVGNWILQTACETACSWQAAGRPLIRVGVNLFSDQFQDDAFVEGIRVLLEQCGLPAEALELEITESIALDRDEATLAKLQTLRTIGVGLAFDDFGTGYASLTYLTRYPLTRIKIDRSFVEKTATSASSADTAIVRSIIMMAHSLGLQVIAEGVETQDQATFLEVMKCDEIQGYLYGRPMPSEQFLHLLSTPKASNAKEFTARIAS